MSSNNNDVKKWRRQLGILAVKAKSHDLNGIVTTLSSSNQNQRPYQRRTFEMTTFSGSRDNTSTGSSWISFHGYPRQILRVVIKIPSTITGLKQARKTMTKSDDNRFFPPTSRAKWNHESSIPSGKDQIGGMK